MKKEYLTDEHIKALEVLKNWNDGVSNKYHFGPSEPETQIAVDLVNYGLIKRKTAINEINKEECILISRSFLAMSELMMLPLDRIQL